MDKTIKILAIVGLGLGAISMGCMAYETLSDAIYTKRRHRNTDKLFDELSEALSRVGTEDNKDKNENKNKEED